jgi:hypothetical protein
MVLPQEQKGDSFAYHSRDLRRFGAALPADSGNVLAACYFTFTLRDMPRILWPKTGQYAL